MEFEALPVGQHIARQADITLVTADDLPLDMDDPGYGFDLGPPDGIGSQDYLDLGLDFGEGPSKTRDDDDNLSIEYNRDAPVLRDPRASLDSALLDQRDKDFDVLSTRSRDASEAGFGGNFDLDLIPDDMGMDLDHGLSFGDELLIDKEPLIDLPIDKEQTPALVKSSRVCTSSHTWRVFYILKKDITIQLLR